MPATMRMLDANATECRQQQTLLTKLTGATEGRTQQTALQTKTKHNRNITMGSVKGQNKWDVKSVAFTTNISGNANAMTHANFNARGCDARLVPLDGRTQWVNGTE